MGRPMAWGGETVAHQRSVRGAAPRNIKHGTGGERIFLARYPRDKGSHFFHRNEAVAWNFREHEVDVCLGDLLEDRRLGGRRCYGVDRDVVACQLFAEGLG